MAIHYYTAYSAEHGTRNFGDDINPELLARLFAKSIIKSPSICIMGIGTLINDRNIAQVAPFAKKIIFSSGAGYGQLSAKLDESWDCACVRGPLTAAKLGLSADAAVTDGALLLADFYQPLPNDLREGVVFIPHINSSRGASDVLRRITEALDVELLLPSAPQHLFLKRIRHASLVLAEAMHGAIVADAMRVPWIPLSFLNHNAFKWRDWLASIRLPYSVTEVRPRTWNPSNSTMSSLVKVPVQRVKERLLGQQFRRAVERAPFMSSDEVYEENLSTLRARVHYVNESYA